MFYVGQKVVCVDDIDHVGGIYGGFPGVLPGMDGLTKGRIYTVAEIGLLAWIDGRPCIRVAEIVRPFPNGPYWAHRFRPIVERKTDISVFTKILTDCKEDA